MATYYVDPAAAGNDDGTSWTDAWTTLQRAIDGTNGTQPVAGDIVYCRGSETLAASVDVDGNSGNNSTGYIRYIGCNASGVVDGTRYVLDGNSAATYCLNCSTEFISFQNFEMTGATSHGVFQDVSTADTFYFGNCYVHTNGGAGFYNNADATDGAYFNCIIANNTNQGIYRSHFNTIVLCSIYGNGDNGLDGSSGDGCFAALNVLADNGDNDANATFDKNWVFLNNVIDGTGQSGAIGIQSQGNGESTIIANRITNCSTGYDNNNDVNVYGFNLFHNNTTDISNTTGLFAAIDHAGNDSNRVDPDAGDGYNNAATMDYNLVAGNTYVGDGTDTLGLGIGS